MFTREAPVGEACVVPEDSDVCLGQRTVLMTSSAKPTYHPRMLGTSVASIRTPGFRRGIDMNSAWHRARVHGTGHLNMAGHSSRTPSTLCRRFDEQRSDRRVIWRKRTARDSGLPSRPSAPSSAITLRRGIPHPPHRRRRHRQARRAQGGRHAALMHRARMTTDTSERGLERVICTSLTGHPCDPGSGRLRRGT